MDLMEMVAIVENFTDSTQMYLRDALKEILFKGKGSAKIKPCAEMEDILGTGIIVRDGAMFAISEQARKKVRKLYTYLSRKYDTELYFNPETCEMIEIPKGAIFTTEMSLIDGNAGVSMQFPDDEVTAMLDLFGTNPCNKLG